MAQYDVLLSGLGLEREWVASSHIHDHAGPAHSMAHLTADSSEAQLQVIDPCAPSAPHASRPMLAAQRGAAAGHDQPEQRRAWQRDAAAAPALSGVVGGPRVGWHASCCKHLC
jgi:hypothetical protein